jgi:hypothetical protein
LSKPALEPTQPPIQWVPGDFSLGVRRPGRAVDHSPPNSAEVKKCGSVHPLPHTPSWRSANLLSPGTILPLRESSHLTGSSAILCS